MQAKILRVLQQRVFERLGGNRGIPTDIRVICATHRDLRRMSEQGRFRQDLYYRLNVVEVYLPPLRERRQEISVLANYFLSFYARAFHKKVNGFSSLALHALEEYNWPGNVRELENSVQRAVVMTEGRTIEIRHLPKDLGADFASRGPDCTYYEEEVRDFKRRLILRRLLECGGRKADVARTLGVARSYLHRLINQLGIPNPEAFAGNPGGSKCMSPPLT